MTATSRRQVLCDIIGLARGLPPSAINPEEFDTSQLVNEIDQLGVSIVALEWAMTAAVALLRMRSQSLSDINDVQYNQTRRPMYSLKPYETKAATLCDLLDMDTVDMTVPITSYQAIMQTGKSKGVLTPDDRRAIMAFAIFQKLSVSRIKKLISEMSRLKETVGDTAIEALLGDMAEVVERRNTIEEGTTTDETVDDG